MLDKISSMAFAKESGVIESTKYPVLGSENISLFPPTLNAIQGIPAEADSKSVNANISDIDG